MIRYSSVAAVVISALICLCYFSGQFYWAFGLTLVLAAQSAIYSPAKYSIIKSIVGSEKLGMAMVSFKPLPLWQSYSALLPSLSILSKTTRLQTDPNVVASKVSSLIGVALVVLSTLEALFAWRIPFYPQETEQQAVFSAKKICKIKLST